jgi:hypothetical protein
MKTLSQSVKRSRELGCLCVRFVDSGGGTEVGIRGNAAGLRELQALSTPLARLFGRRRRLHHLGGDAGSRDVDDDAKLT